MKVTGQEGWGEGGSEYIEFVWGDRDNRAIRQRKAYCAGVLDIFDRLKKFNSFYCDIDTGDLELEFDYESLCVSIPLSELTDALEAAGYAVSKIDAA